MSASDPLLSALVRHRDELDQAISLRATEIVRAWMIKTSRAHLCRQRAIGFLQCTACGGFFAGARGLLALH